ncbi:MAG: phytoene desaturase family protein [Actinomycetota bacterium]|nr:phytoene desaturase family protein [Actinomycetota bacterium]
MPGKSKVIVIGAGVGGLATAARLAAKGKSVTVLEQANHFGGKLAAYRRDGFVFDTGPSLFTLPAVYRDLFLKTGAPLEEAIDLQPLDPAFRYQFSDGATVVMPGVGAGQCADALAAGIGGKAAEEWRTLIKRGGEMWQITREPFLQSPLAGWRNILALAKNPSHVQTVAPFMTLRSLGEKTFSDKRLVTLLDRYATYTGSDPRKAPAVLATVPYVEQTFGTWHIGGGVSSLADALVQRCRDLGVELHTNTNVTSISTTGNEVTGVRTGDGEAFMADIVVANADAGQVYGSLLNDAGAQEAMKGIRKSTPSLAGFVLLLAVNDRTQDLKHHNVWFTEDYDAEFDAIFGRNIAPVSDPTIYVCAPRDPLMSPDADHESWSVLVNAPRHGDGTNGTVNWDEPGLAEQYADHVLGVLARRGMDIRPKIRWREIRTPADLERDVRAPGGAIYGTSSNGARAAFARPANESPVGGLYLVGGSSHPGGGLPLVGMSAEIVANLINGTNRD